MAEPQVKKKSKRTLTPKLRFPEFRGQWDEVQLSQLANSISARVGTMPCIPYTVTSGLGLVSQEEKFGRTIAGNSLRNYIRLQKDDFAYNKSATNAYPEGYITRYLDEAKAAVPNSIFTCFRVDSEKVDPAYLDFLFAGNLHGRWLRKFITIGARAHGSLNVSDDDLMALPVPLPSPPEQKKIAECLNSLDDLIAAEGRMLESLKTHKKGLMQQLFPQPGQTQPRLRFPEFRDKGEWVEENLDELFHLQDGFAFKSTDFVKAQEDAIQVIRITDINNKNTNEDKVYIPCAFLERNKLGKYMVNDGDLLLSLTGAAGFNFFFWNGGQAIINQRTAKVTAKNKSDYALVRLLEPLVHEKINIRGEGQNNNLSKEFLRSVTLLIPRSAEQQKIASCLTSLDTRIAAQAAKIETLKQHKRGLMQQLFPAPEEQ